jgi:hypothetical protein
MASSKALDLLSFDNIVFSHYAFYTSAVLLKVLGLGSADQHETNAEEGLLVSHCSCQKLLF